MFGFRQGYGARARRASLDWFLASKYVDFAFDHDYNGDRYAVTQVALPSIAAATAAALKSKRTGTFDEGTSLIAGSTVARTYYDAGLVLKNDLAVNQRRMTFIHGKRQWRLENAATCILAYSEDANQWTAANVVITNNAIAAPDGATTADLIDDQSAVAFGSIQRNTASAVTNGGPVCISRFFKADTSSIAFLQGFGGIPDTGVYYNLATGAWIARSGTTAPVAAGMVSYGNGWWRCWFIQTASSAAVVTVGSAPAYRADMTGGAPQASGTGRLYMWGANVTETAFLSDYIPTGAAAVTRAIESAEDAAITLALCRRSAFAQLIRLRLDSVASGTIWRIDDGTDSNRIQVAVSAGAVTLLVVSGGVTVASITPATTISAGADFGIAFRCAANDYQIAVNGVLGSADTSGAMPTGLTQAALCRSLVAPTTYAAAHLNRRAISPDAANDATLQAWGVAA